VVELCDSLYYWFILLVLIKFILFNL
jgi:hypothetical protein